MSAVRFARLRGEHAEELYELRMKALRTVPTAFGASVQDDIERGVGFYRGILGDSGEDNVVFGAWERDTLVGMVGVLRHPREKTGHKNLIWGMFVDESQRGKKLGAGLLDLAIAHSRDKMGVRLVQLEVATNNAAAKALYLSRGFQFWGREPMALFVNGSYNDEEHYALVFEPQTRFRAHEIDLHDRPNAPELAAIGAGLRRHNQPFGGSEKTRELTACVRDENGRVIAGLYGHSDWGWLFIKWLWVDENHRKHGWGRKLMTAAEVEAVKRGCTGVWLDTFSFQARGFYEKLGYVLFGKLDDYPAGQNRVFLEKRLPKEV